MKFIGNNIREFDLLRVVVWSVLIGYALTTTLWTGVKVLRLIF
ncbi:MAG TPA: hypothetical protein PLV21_13715 [Cyclobacteriaceae bacterium]|nr:hypothetical protein [Cyclobacteriaceae bacterium]HRJ82943.1 hypothetical protein [Cyclobacteriaceae bacterium]